MHAIPIIDHVHFSPLLRALALLAQACGWGPSPQAATGRSLRGAGAFMFLGLGPTGTPRRAPGDLLLKGRDLWSRGTGGSASKIRLADTIFVTVAAA